MSKIKVIDCCWASKEFTLRPDLMHHLDSLLTLNLYQEGNLLKSLEILPHEFILKYHVHAISVAHWSRAFELPWAMKHINPQWSDQILDVGGGESILQFAVAPHVTSYVNLEPDKKSVDKMLQSKLFQLIGRRVKYHEAKLQDWYGTLKYSKVICISVLEHDPDPVECIRKLWSHVGPNGRLILTFDMASYARWNHTIDEKMATEMLSLFGAKLPDFDLDRDMLGMLNEIDPKPDEPKNVYLKVLCLCVEKSE